MCPNVSYLSYNWSRYQQNSPQAVKERDEGNDFNTKCTIFHIKFTISNKVHRRSNPGHFSREIFVGLLVITT